ncbi:MAG: hypothetical protein M3Q34_02910 [bacterium]|nr:hypothetical protein [bacterium]
MIKSPKIILVLSLLAFTIIISFFALKDTKEKITLQSVDVPSISVPCVSSPGSVVCSTPDVPHIAINCIPSIGAPCPIENEITVTGTNTVLAVPNQSNDIMDVPWPRTYRVIASSIISKKDNGENGRTFAYGEKILMGQDREIKYLDPSTKASGFFIKEDEGLLLEVFYPAFKKVFTVDAASYKNIPIEIKYKMLERAGTPCGISGLSDSMAIASFLAGNIPNKIWYSHDKWSGLLSCNPNFSLPRSAFIAEHSVVEANLDNDIKTPKHVLAIMENQQQYGNGGNCAGVPIIFAIDTNGNYYARDLSNFYQICYVGVVKKGETVQITKTTYTPEGKQTSLKEDYTFLSDSFALYQENDQITYLLYDKTTSTQVKSLSLNQQVYPSEDYH